MRSALFFFLACGLSAQILINAGGPPNGQYSADPSTCNVTGGSTYGPANQADMSKQSGIYQTLRYGSTFSYDCPAPIGTCKLTLDLLENRPAVAAASVPAAGPGLRVFAVKANDASSGNIDIFAAAGAQTPFKLGITPVTVTDGHLRISFSASKGNAVVSGLEITCTPDPPPAPPPLTIGGCVVSGSIVPGTILVARKWPDGSCHIEGSTPLTLVITDPFALGLPPTLTNKPPAQ